MLSGSLDDVHLAECGVFVIVQAFILFLCHVWNAHH